MKNALGLSCYLNELIFYHESIKMYSNWLCFCIFRKKGEKVRKELEEAAREGSSRSSIGSGGSNEERILDSMPYYTVSLPTKVALRFVSSFL